MTTTDPAGENFLDILRRCKEMPTLATATDQRNCRRRYLVQLQISCFAGRNTFQACLPVYRPNTISQGACLVLFRLGLSELS